MSTYTYIRFRYYLKIYAGITLSEYNKYWNILTKRKVSKKHDVFI